MSNAPNKAGLKLERWPTLPTHAGSGWPITTEWASWPIRVDAASVGGRGLKCSSQQIHHSVHHVCSDRKHTGVAWEMALREKGENMWCVVNEPKISHLLRQIWKRENIFWLWVFCFFCQNPFFPQHGELLAFIMKLLILCNLLQVLFDKMQVQTSWMWFLV